MVEERLLRTLRRYVSPLNARVILEQARQKAGPTGEHRSLVEAAGSAAGLFLGPTVRRGLDRDLARVLQNEPSARPPPATQGASTTEASPEAAAAYSSPPIAPSAAGAVVVSIVAEPDVSVARLAAWDLCVQLGARRLIQQKVATAVSELARNIVNYTPGGSVRLESLGGDPPRLSVVAEDRGKGIANLAEVLSGAYKSRTGLGRGLLGVKRLMDRFDVRTGPTGTRVEAEAVLR